MSDNSWVLRGIDPEARDRAEEEAARLGVSVSDFLADLVVRQAIRDQLGDVSENEQTSSQPDHAPIFAPPPESSEGFAVRQRLKTLERRLSAAVGSLDGAIAAVDTSLFDITARVGDVEALAGDTAHALGQVQQDVSNAVAGLQIHLAVVEDNLAAQTEAQEARAAGLDRRIDGVEHIARGAERSAAILGDAHEALKHAVATDFSEFTHETVERLNAGLAEVRAAADAAAEQADAAVRHLINELRGLRASIEQRLEDSAEQTRDRMQAAFADAANRMAALGGRVSDAEHLVSRTAEQLRAQMADIEDGAQIALEATAHALRETDAALAADISRSAQEHYAALETVQSDLRARMETVRADLATEIAALREDQTSQLARLKLVDVAIGNTIGSIAELRGSFENRIAEAENGVDTALQQAAAQWQAQADALTQRVLQGEQQTQTAHERLSAELTRLEASVFAGLEKMRRDIGAGGAAVTQRLEGGLAELRREVDEVRNRAIEEVHLLREEQAGALARITLLDTALTRLEGGSISINGRIAELEAAFADGNSALEQRIAQLEHAAAAARVESLGADSAAADRLAALEQRLAIHESKAGEIGESVQDVVRMLNRVAAQSVETAQRIDDGAHRTDLALADLRLELLAKSEADHLVGALQALQERMTAFELRQNDALEKLRGDIARLVADNDRRLAALETQPPAERNELAAEFESLRSRIEERVLGVELRSVRTLEQVVDTMALLEQRLLDGSASGAQAAKSA